MKRCLFVSIGVICLVVLAAADYPRLITHPQIPTTTELAQLGLKRHWHTYIPIQGARDGISFLQILHNQIVVQSRMGAVASLDLEGGTTQWRVLPGVPYQAFQIPCGVNEHNIVVLAGGKLCGLDRKTGMTEWSLEVPGIPATAAAADDEHLYVGTSDGMVRGYFLPFSLRQSLNYTSRSEFEEALRRRGLSSERINSRIPEMIWSYKLPAAMRVAPAVFGTHVVLADGEGTVYSIENERRSVGDMFRAGGSVVADLAQTGDMFYLASLDRQVYAGEQVSGKMELRWRYTAGSKILQKPMPIGQDLFVVSKDEGMTRLDRFSGTAFWSLPSAKRFLAASHRLVIGLDDHNQMLIIDRSRGSILATWSAKAFTILSPNEYTDRIVLASHDGLILCLRDMDPRCEQPTLHIPKTEPKKVAEPIVTDVPKKPKKADMEMDK